MLKTYKFTLAFLLWMAFITFLSLYSFSDFNKINMEIAFIDKAVHFVFYSVATILVCLLTRERSNGKFPLRSTLIYAAFFMLFYGTIIEVIQAVYTTDRSGEIGDFVANLVGVISGLFIVNKGFSSNSRLKWRH